MRAKAIKNGDWNGIVSADKAREHLQMLSRSGIGRRLVSDVCGVRDSLLADIKMGRRRNIRQRTERVILAVTQEARSRKTLVLAKPVWAQINRLLREGFTKSALARRLGSKAKQAALQINKRVVTAETAMKVERLHARIMAGVGVRTRANLQPIRQRHRA